MNPAIATNLPAEPGSYALVFQLGQSHRLRVGRLGTARFQAGRYIYLGSAQGPGGLRARLVRHVKGEGSLHWHVDYLRRVAPINMIYYLAKSVIQHASPVHHFERLECRWSQAIANLEGACYPMPGFGSSDCQSGCSAHLVRSDSMPELIYACLAESSGVQLSILVI